MEWKYRTLKPTVYTEDHFEEILNEMGKQGWELIGNFLGMLVFKQPIQKEL